jgi:glycosyltransferase involved in cell wall biosynthesis
MKILFLTDNFPPESNAPARRTYEHCVEWAKSGEDVTVITCWPNFPGGAVYEGYKNRLYGRTDTNGIKVKRVWSYISPNKGFLRRTIDYLSFSLSSFLVGVFTPCDIVIATSPQFFTTFSARAISFFRRVPWVFELRDIWPESISAVGAMKRGRAFRALEKIELCLYRSSSLVLAVSPAFKTNLILRGIDAAKIAVIPNGVHQNFRSNVNKDNGLTEKMGLTNKFVVGYIGTHGMAHALDFVLRCAAKVDNPKIHFLFVGDGAEKQRLVTLASKLQLSNVLFCDAVRSADVPDYLSIVDVALIPLRRSDTFLSVIPSKIFESSAMQIPILLGVDGQAREIVEEYDAGEFYQPEEEVDFLFKLRLLAENTALYQAHQLGCQRLAIAYDRSRLAKEALEAIRSIQR